MRLTVRRVAVAGMIWMLAGPSAGGQQPAGAQAPAPTFRSGVELVSIDTTVVDNTGRPVPGIGADRFEVLVDGRRRRVVSAQYIDLSGGSKVRPEAAPPAARGHFTANEVDTPSPPPPDRLVVVAVDHSSFLPGGGRQTLESARRFVGRLDPSDRVALVAYPDPGLFIPPTTDHGTVIRALGRVAGTAERIEPAHVEINIGLNEAVEIAGGDRQTYDRVVARECLGTGAPIDVDQCRALIELDAPQMVAQLRDRTARSLNGVIGLLDTLGAMAGRKTLVLISAGLAASAERPQMDIMSELRAASDRAGRAETVIHALHAESALSDAFGVDRRRVPTSPRADADLMSTGLEALVDMNGGALFKVPASADAVLSRITREISAYYALGIEPEPSDRDGKPHTIRVRVAGGGVTVRHRQQFTIARPTAVDASPDETLATVLRSGQTMRDLPLRVGTHVMRDLASEHVRVIVRADIGRDVAVPANVRVGLAVFDAAGQPTGATSSLRSFDPTPGPDGTWPYQEVLTLRPGRYTLRLAARDADGRVGSVVHGFDATLHAGARATMSDVLVADPGRASGTQPATVVDGRLRSEVVNALVEVYPAQGATVSDVSFDLRAAGAEARLVHAVAALSARPQERRVLARGDLDIGRVAPGEYVVTATAFDRGTEVGRVSRTVTVVRAERTAGGGDGAVTARFRPADVLRPDAMAPIVARLREADPSVPADVGAAVLAGDFDRAARAFDGVAGPSLGAAFERGLAAFARGEIEPAATQFRSALRLSRDFMPAAFFLGACDAAGGRDEQAIEAWRTVIIAGGDLRIVYEVLADAWVRLGNGPEAQAVTDAALAKWPGDPAFVRRQARIPSPER